MSHMSTSSVIMLVAVWGVILANMLYCFFRLLTSQRSFGGEDE
ncbi:hypothetical protein ETAA8_13630 [Anatilimnocola aggregata]|uniref:Uncharacterized protein n=1 Tax=Anatilimnocola aggregata TaxID=2528021 RepID=A0A517Y7V3_9BACT|nr:hypothetical protein ETAA8_13630 [Anatilimnocola aggregata]